MKKRILCSLLLAINILFCLAQTMQRHMVQRGETLESIAQKYGVTVADLKAANPDRGEYFYVGMVLNVPKSASSTPKTGNQNVPEKKSTTKKARASVSETTSPPVSAPTTVVQQTPVVQQETSYTAPVSSSTSLSTPSRKGKWEDLGGKIGWYSRAYSKGQDMDGFGLLLEFDSNYFIEEQVFLKLGIGWALAHKVQKQVSSSMNSILVPVSVNYLVPIGKSGGLSFGAGPYFDYVLSGETEYGSGKNKLKIKFSDVDGAHALVLGFQVRCSYMFSWGLGLYGEYGFGLTERYKDIRENYWSAGLAFNF